MLACRRASEYTMVMGDLFDVSFMKKLELLTISARRAFRGQMRGERRSPRQGSSVEFSDYRQYVPGDDFRRIDWNAFARFENLLVKLFREEEDLHLCLLCDASSSMAFGEPSKFDYIRRVAAALAYVALNNADCVSVVLLGAEDDSPSPVHDLMRPRRGKGAIFDVFNFLEAAPMGGQTDLAASVRYLLSRKLTPGVAVVLSDMLLHNGYEQALQLLSYENFQPMVVHVMAPQEIAPSLQGDLRLRDSETGAHVDVSATKRTLAMYQKHVASFRRKLADFAQKNATEYVFASSETPFEDLVLQWMRQANMLT